MIVILGTAVVCIYLGSKLKKQLKEEIRASSRLEVRVDLVFTLVVIAATAMGLYLSRSWPRGTALFPRVIGSAVIILSVFSLIRGLGGLRRALANAPRGPLPPRDDEFAVRAPVIFGWLVGFCILTWAFGFEIGCTRLRLFLHAIAWKGQLVKKHFVYGGNRSHHHRGLWVNLRYELACRSGMGSNEQLERDQGASPADSA